MKVVASVADTTESDQELATRFAREAEPLFEVLARRARQLTRSGADAEDLLQDTLLHAFVGFRTFREGSNLKAWLFRILYNRWVSTHRSKQSRPAEVSVDAVTEHDLTDSAARLPIGLRSAEAVVLDMLPDHDIKAAMEELPEGFRSVVYYADVQGYTYAQTAAILGIPLGTVTSRVSRGRQRLRIALAPIADGQRDAVADEQRIA